MRSTRFAIGLLLLSALSIYAQAASPAEPQGKVMGIVLDEQNLPIDDAQVCTRVNLPDQTLGNCYVHTNSTGQFQIDHLPMGTFDVFAAKYQDGYVAADHAPGMQTITLTPEAALANIVLQLGPKEGVLAPSVKDKVTGEPVYDFMVRWHVDGGNDWRAGGEGFSRWTTRAAIPAEQDVIIDEVSARGYEKWVAGGPSVPSRSLQLHVPGGEVQSLNIELEPEANAAARAR